MTANDILLVGLARSVAAFSRSDGRELWSTKLTGPMGADFVTLACDGANVFAYSGGHLHCLQLFTGHLLWTNKLPGYGYGLATLCLPGQAASNTASAKAVLAARDATAASSPPPG